VSALGRGTMGLEAAGHPLGCKKVVHLCKLVYGKAEGYLPGVSTKNQYPSVKDCVGASCMEFNLTDTLLVGCGVTKARWLQLAASHAMGMNMR